MSNEELPESERIVHEYYQNKTGMNNVQDISYKHEQMDSELDRAYSAGKNEALQEMKERVEDLEITQYEAMINPNIYDGFVIAIGKVIQLIEEAKDARNNHIPICNNHNCKSVLPHRKNQGQL